MVMTSPSTRLRPVTSETDILALGDQLVRDLELADDLLRRGLAPFHGEAPARSGLLRPLIRSSLVLRVQVRAMG